MSSTRLQTTAEHDARSAIKQALHTGEVEGEEGAVHEGHGGADSTWVRSDLRSGGIGIIVPKFGG